MLQRVERAAPVPVQSRTDRLMARIALVIVAGGLVYGFYSLGGPVYWKFYATIIHPFQDHHPVPAKTAAPVVTASPADAGAAAGGAGGANTAKAAVVEEPKPSPSPPPVVASPPPPKDFNPDHYPLTRERVLPLLQDNLIMITWANHHYLDFAKSWVYNLRKSGVRGFMVGAMDDDMLKDLVLLDIPCWRMNTGITKRDLGWGSQNFHLMGRFKIKLIRDVLNLDVSVVVSDIDTAWLKNPIPYFHRYPEADILTSTDQLGPTVTDDSLEKFPQAGSAFNIGIMLFRPTSKGFVDDWVKSLDDPKMWDQTAFNDLARKGHGMSEPPKNLWKGYEGKLTVGVLPSSIFASGHVFFVQKKYEEYGLEPYVAHATFQYSGTPGKRHRFREFMLFDDPPEYYDHPVGFVEIDMDIPQALLDAAAKPVTGPMTGDKLGDHFALVHHQLFRLRAAIAVALILKRVIVLPPIWCQLDKYWAPLYDGNIPGSHWKKPFICPADHVLDLEGGWFHHRPEFGDHLQYKEYSFFRNIRMSKEVNESRVVVDVCKPGAEDGCAKGDAPAGVQNGVIRLAPNRNSDEIAKALDSVKDKKIITLKNAADAFKEFSNPEEQNRFVNRLNHYTSVDCCLESNPGWVWYDFFADRAHSDRFGRKFDAVWKPRRGDTDQLIDGYKTPGRRLASVSDGAGAAAEEERSDDLAVMRRDQGAGSGAAVARNLALPERVGLPRRLQSEESEMQQEVRFLHSMEMEAMFSAP
ncbi:hypothetical protein HYH03_005220 [Edaphochlamys debaryana]|uniref:Nucleotide-diphospho-sugar transferase domain-containing protein n=1 Tax=Edaphochlamys debaryana TaxID=47281 RepID=A0A835Y814_9CHLO|nr:hypothetical protein HYH03_005220 [Edaphochlamys debaryana]|eukprot:KAG2496814.1 hypothetical protein HYH03_005220 [Edaphochlamys debaryana]